MLRAAAAGRAGRLVRRRRRRRSCSKAAHDLDHAVARGAAYYGWAKQRGGVRIRGGTARAYYVGIETAGLAVPGAPRPLRALCVVPIGMEEGTETDVPVGRDRPGGRRAGPVPLLQLLDPQARPARRRARRLDARRARRDRFAGDDAPGRRRRSTSPTCPSASTRGSPSWACSSCGA